LLMRHLGSFRWHDGDRRWLLALAAWGAFLVADGLVAFLPGILERWKFTNAMVAHAHLAMAGFVTSLMVLVLQGILRQRRIEAFDEEGTFWLWQSGTLLMVAALTILGVLEGKDAGLLSRREAPVLLLYGLRWLAGLSMVVASCRWLRLSLGGAGSESSRQQPRDSEVFA
jgi:cytochrome c oxidase cbb3-type subunit I